MIAWLALPALATPTHSQIDAAGWSTVGTVNDASAGEVTISRATIDGVECFRGAAKTDLAPSKLLAVVADIESATRWSSAGLTESKLLAKSGSELSYYQYLDVPGWTMSADRYWFLRSTVSDGAEQASLAWSRLENGGAFGEIYAKFKAEHADAVEPPVNVGSWTFLRNGAATDVIYAICTVPGGSIPQAIQNAATKKTLPGTVGDVVREARKR
jgi:hypothetical protein